MNVEKEYLGKKRAKIWTYVFLGVLLIVAIVVANFALTNPETAREGAKSFLGLPRWAFPAIVAAVGAFLYWIGLKVETDRPEAIGAMMIAGSLAAAEVMIGWNKFAVGGLVVIPYILPIALLVVLLIVGIVKSK